MALIGKIAIAMGVDTKGLHQGFRKASVEINQFHREVSMAGVALAAAFVGTGALAAVGLAKMVKEAMSLGEQSDRARIVFGDFAGDVIAQAGKMADAFGISRSEFIQSAGALGSIFKAAGYTQEGAEQLSIHFVKLATDLSSLVHIPVQEALEKIQSGLAGQVRPLREVGVFMSEAAVEAYAVANGISKMDVELTESQKIQARVGFITNALKDAQGNLALTADSAANRLRAMWGEINNLAASIGSALLPIVGAALSDINTGLQVLQKAWLNLGFAATDATTGVIGAAQTQTTSIGLVQMAIGKVADAWKYVELGLLAVSANVVPAIVTLIDTIGSLARALDKIIELTTGASTGVGQFFTNMAAGLEKAGKETDKLFQAKLKEFFEGGASPSEEINKAFEAARQKTAALRAELGKMKIDVNKIIPGVVPVVKKPHEGFAGAMELGSQEAANTILRSKYGAGQGAKVMEDVRANTKKSSDHLAKLVDILGGGGGGGMSLEVWASF